eukprot:TRINITY_DN1765_c0_g2_i4.p1 TRINITY_DN1765_c0_g2~~TRINITY_DN1765_c0_g2_i4.p1  ORF type:complete len:391 (+),score=36.38 TRINITY_DN1765_c0_g2_i4:125-1297(+)
MMMALPFTSSSLLLLSMLASVSSVNVQLFILDSAVASGSVCLDGSAPAYFMDKGFGSGANNWIVHFEGGAWCNDVQTCSDRTKTRLGSSKYMPKQKALSGLFGNNQARNPYFYNWNKVRIQYCDGASFTGDVEAVDPKTNLHFRGQRVFQAVINDLKAKGLSNAQQALLSGCSAGGLAAIIHCDRFRGLLPSTAKVKCLSDAGFFMDVKDVSGGNYISNLFQQVVDLHQSTKSLPAACTSKLGAKCFFPQNLLPYVQTPLFLLNAAYDSWQIKNSLASGKVDSHGTWRDCKLNIQKCSSNQLSFLHEFRNQMIAALKGFESSSTGGMFINSCYTHCQAGVQETWFAANSPRLNNKSLSEAIGEWYTENATVKLIDCPYPCDSTCHNREFE